MNWADIAGAVGKTAPILGALLGGPAGLALNAAGSIVASVLGVAPTPDAVSQALTINPDAAVKLAQIEKDRQVELQTLVTQVAVSQLVSDTAAITAVNATMQAEVKSEHWASWLWRPFNGFVFGTTFFGVYFVLPLAHIPSPVIPMEAWASIGAILGVASWFRGKAQADVNNPAPVRG
ncbi:MAG: hypothetical protein JWQ89_3553 [Devosia sp.]|uniref:3TM-type holin n=1 Tax=Devosia sp. TaxID=1871048 RepID=UPI0026118AEC|nr:3TM-type holin [Devosia sp.]MDB5541826.1 hypothetical protein [Devosia sp.]